MSYQVTAYKWVYVKESGDVRLLCNIGQGYWDWIFCSNVIRVDDNVCTTRSGACYELPEENSELFGEAVNLLDQLEGMDNVEILSKTPNVLLISRTQVLGNLTYRLGQAIYNELWGPKFKYLTPAVYEEFDTKFYNSTDTHYIEKFYWEHLHEIS